MRFQLATTLVALLATSSTLAEDAGVSSIVSEFDSIKSEIYALTTATGSGVTAAGTSLGSVLASFIVSVSTDSDWPAASAILMAQAALESANLPSIRSSAITPAANSTSKSGHSSQSAAAGRATISGLPSMITAGIAWTVAIGVFGAAVLL
jgi:hypothetical protein